MHCQVPGIDYSLSKLAIHSALESATAIALSHAGVLYIAETDEKKINRVRRVSTSGEISLLAGAGSECASARMTFNCNCFSGDDRLRLRRRPQLAPPRWPSHPTARSSSPTSTTSASARCGGEPAGALAHGGCTRWRLHRNRSSMCSAGRGDTYRPSASITGEPLYNFSYGADGETRRRHR
ncbi:hypothetical protein SKAU_G00426190 [Synaphobranchus kaupii]|uniref:Teneurin NHL domain-containing protein n=1 Tax=Synaphobranchus kaupii TaxID=118154 RepID=A0A9Q1IAE7_SYNKA|nr:hypothetical protein SKAU_G00426190 [Synaphobranchus kaupii]